MAESKSNARLRADAGAPTSGVIHVRTRLTADFTVIANALAQRRGSAVTVGVAAYILSLPDGAPVSIAALCEHFTEGEILISRALRELEAAGYLERRRMRSPRGAIHTRTYFHDVPPQDLPTPPDPPTPPHPRRSAAAEAPVPVSRPQPAPQAGTGPATGPATSTGPGTAQAPALLPEQAPPAAPGSADHDPRALVLLASLRIRDPRLLLSRRDVAVLAPAVTRWLDAGVDAAQVTHMLTAGLPDRFLSRPARLLAYRLSEPPLPAPAPNVNAAASPTVLPWQTCDGGCDRPFRAAAPGPCRDCRTGHEAAAAPATPGVRLPVAC